MRNKQSIKQKKHCKSKLFLMLTALTLVLCTIITGTVAWLIADTDPVINTFTYGDINILLDETDTNKDGDNNPNTNNYAMMPGNPITKDPKVTFKANSENAWLFVKLEKSSNFDDFMEYTVLLDDPATTEVEGWIALENNEGVYYRSVDKADADAEYFVIENNTVTVKDTVTKEMLNALDVNGANNYPTLTVTAYAVQRDERIASASDAWGKITANNP